MSSLEPKNTALKLTGGEEPSRVNGKSWSPTSGPNGSKASSLGSGVTNTIEDGYIFRSILSTMYIHYY